MKSPKKHDAKLFGGFGIFPFSLVMLVAFIPVFAAMPINGFAHHSWTNSFHARSAKRLPFAERADAISVAVTADGDIYFGGDRYSGGERVATIRELSDSIIFAVANGSERRVYLLVDSRAQYASVKTALEAVRAAHIEEVSFVTDETILPQR